MDFTIFRNIRLWGMTSTIGIKVDNKKVAIVEYDQQVKIKI